MATLTINNITETEQDHIIDMILVHHEAQRAFSYGTGLHIIVDTSARALAILNDVQHDEISVNHISIKA